MRVWIVFRIYGDGATEVCGVFATRELADACKSHLDEHDDSGEGHYIEEYAVLTDESWKAEEW